MSIEHPDDTPSLDDHPMAIFHTGESYASPREREWLAFVRGAEKLLGHPLDGDQEKDGYSLDYAHDAFADGVSVADYVAEVREEKDRRRRRTI